MLVLLDISQRLGSTFPRPSFIGHFDDTDQTRFKCYLRN